jgi:hypothetical protein
MVMGLAHGNLALFIRLRPGAQDVTLKVNIRTAQIENLRRRAKPGSYSHDYDRTKMGKCACQLGHQPVLFIVSEIARDNFAFLEPFNLATRIAVNLPEIFRLRENLG